MAKNDPKNDKKKKRGERKNEAKKKPRQKKPRRERLGFCIAGNIIALLIDKGLEHRGSKGLRGTVLSLVAAGGVGMDVTTCA